MILLHAGVCDDRLLLWAETSIEDVESSSRRGGAKPRTRVRASEPHSQRPLPYDAGEGGLAVALEQAGLGLKTTKGQMEATIAWLPTVGGQPIASSSLIAEPPRSRAKTVLQSWTITGLPLTPEQLVDVLCQCIGKQLLAPGIMLGNDVAFWASVLRFAGALVARQQFLPGVVNDDDEDSYRASWLPVFAGTDADLLTRLAKAMPHACRALTREADSPPKTSALPLLQQMIGEMVDHLAGMAFSESAVASVSTRRPTRSRQKRTGSFDSMHDQWLSSLRSTDRRLEGDTTELNQLSAQVREWRQPIALASGMPFRLCFRLEEPDDADDAEEGSGKSRRKQPQWWVRYLLQARDDPSLLIPAPDAWQAKGGKATLLKRDGFDAHECLLSSLGQAAGICPRIEASLKIAAPSGYQLDSAGAHEFLTEKAILLEQAGFGVLLPAWWTRRGTKLRFAARAEVKSPKMQGGGGLSLESIVEFRWQVALGNEQISAQELAALAKLKQPLVKVRGQWVQMNAEEIQAALAFWEKQGTHKTSVRDVVQMALGAGQTPGGIEFDGVTASGWIADFLAELDGRAAFEELPVPEGFQGTLRPYQLRGYSWLGFLRQWGLGACLADDMGLGKCLSADSLITVNGTLVKAEDIWQRYAGETIFDAEGYWAEPTEPLLTNSIERETGQIVESQIRRLYRQRIHERLRKITLEDGSSVTITRAHKLLTDQGWTHALQVGDYVCVPAKNVWDGEPADPDLIKLLAWQIAEGYEQSERGTVSITQKDTERLHDLHQTFLRIAQRYNLKINCPKIRVYSGKVPALVVNSQAYRRFLESMGYCWGRLSRQKTIPPFILQSDLESIQLFLRHYFDAESSVLPSMRSIEISSASFLLMQQLALLLRRCGIWIRISAKQKHATNGTGIFRTYYIGVIGGNSARKFLHKIGFGNPDKQRRLEAICEHTCNTNVEGIPASDMVAQTIELTGLPLRHLGMYNTVYIDGSQQFSRASLERVVAGCERVLSGEAEQEYLSKKPSKWTAQTLAAYARLNKPQLREARQHLQGLLDQEVFYCKIKTIEDVDYDGWVYDFEVSDHHNFVANNILCHNTIQTLTLLQRDWELNGKQPVLLICPTSVVGNWHKEAERFTPQLPVMVHHGAGRKKGAKFQTAAKKQAIVVSSYALLQRDFEDFNGVPWGGVILDEAQNIKNPETKQARAARALQADYRVVLTGTPVENNVGDLWSLMEFLNPGFLGTQAAFKRNFFVPIQAHRDAETTERLKRLTGPFILRRLKTDKTIITDLPEKMEMKVFCTLTKEQGSLYAAVVEESLSELDNADGIQRRGKILGTLSKLKQVCNHPAQFLGDNSAISGRSGKLARLTEMLEEILAVEECALIFSQFAEMGTLLRRHLQETFGREVLFLHGAVSKTQRDRMVERFQSESNGPPIFILSLKAGGTGLNLTRANHVFHFDRWWNPAVENQATDRAFRIGQTKNVQVHKFLCAGTLEEKIDEMIERKQEVAQQVVGTGEGWLTELSTTELKDLFALRKDAIGD